MAWSSMEGLEEKYSGLQTTFKKLKERQRLTSNDITPLRQFVDSTITCTTNTAEIKKIFRPEDHNSEAPTDQPTALRQFNLKGSTDNLSAFCQTNSEKSHCDGECDPAKCNSCAWMCAELVRQRVIAVNTHHHTKTCIKKRPGCRFGIPRPPSDFTIIAQAMPEEVKKIEEKTVETLQYIMWKVNAELAMKLLLYCFLGDQAQVEFLFM